MNKVTRIMLMTLLLGSAIYFMVNKNQQQNKTSNNNFVSKGYGGYEFDSMSMPSANAIKLNEPTAIKYRIKNNKGEIVKNFELNHEKLMHFIIVRKDLELFEHLHPTFNTETGEFSVDITFTLDGPYRFFTDFIPGDDNPQKQLITLSGDINVGNVLGFQPLPVAVDSQNKITDKSGYEIVYALPESIPSGIPVSIILTVSKNGQAVTNMEKYVGAQAHGVLLKKDSLEYAHLHAMGTQMTHMMDGKMMSMEGPMPTGPEVKFDYTFPKKGVYKLFTQFQHQGKVITASYVLDVL